MVVMNGKFDGRQVVLDGPVPPGVAPGTAVRVVFESAGADAGQPQAQSPAPTGLTALKEIAKLAGPGRMPPDYAEQHEHYVKGTPRR